MRFAILACMLLTPPAALAQDDAAIVSAVEKIRYPVLGEQARIHGQVLLSSGPEGVKVISGHPLLAPVALESLKELGKVWATQVEVVYHFVLVSEVQRATKTTVKKGNAFDRFFLRVLGMKTEKVVEDTECVADPNSPKNRIDLTRIPVEVWVFGRERCVLPLVSYFASR